MKPKMVEAGQPIKVGELSLTVLLELESGRNKRVYKVKDQRGVQYVYKHTKKRDVKKEVERAARLARHGLTHSKIVASGSDFILREWVQGMRGDDWLTAWESFGAPMDVEAVVSLFGLLDKSARAGVYVGSLEPKDLVWDGAQWSIFNCGSIRELPPKEVATRYFWKMLERWGQKLDRHRTALRGVGTALGTWLSVFSALGKGYAEPIDASETMPADPASSGTGAYAKASVVSSAGTPYTMGKADTVSPEAEPVPQDAGSSDDIDDVPSSGDIDDESPSSGSLPPDELEAELVPEVRFDPAFGGTGPIESGNERLVPKNAGTVPQIASDVLEPTSSVLEEAPPSAGDN